MKTILLITAGLVIGAVAYVLLTEHDDDDLWDDVLDEV